nr:hypothetical protein [Plesiomonas shigelloides]
MHTDSIILMFITMIMIMGTGMLINIVIATIMVITMLIHMSILTVMIIYMGTTTITTRTCITRIAPQPVPCQRSVS